MTRVPLPAGLRSEVARRGLPRVVAVALVGAVIGSAVTLIATEWSAENLTAISTVILVAVTATYAFLVHAQIQVMQDQGVDRDRARAEEGAQIALEAIYSSGIRPGAPDGRYASVSDVFHALEQRAPFVQIVDGEVADRMRAAGAVAWTCSWGDKALEREGRSKGIDLAMPGLVRMRTGVIVERCSATLQAFLTSQPLPDWDDLPPYVGAQAWALRPGAG